MMCRLIIGLSVLWIASCSLLPHKNAEKGEAIARVYDKYLYAADLAGLIPPGTAETDSTEITNAYVNNWLRQQLLLVQAERNLGDSHNDFTKEIEQYRNSLIIYAYESELVSQKLDTVITMPEIEKYYNENQDNFRLRENIVLANYAKIVKTSPAAIRIKALMQSNRDSDKEKLQTLCQENAADFTINDGTWQSFTDLSRKIPLTIDDQEDFLKSNRYYEVSDSTMLYVVAISAYKNKESVSPLNFEIENIRALILNKRKARLLSQMEEDLMGEAVKRNEYEILKK